MARILKFSPLIASYHRAFLMLVGNVIDHYDTALYGFMVPVIAPLFFPHHDRLSQWILGYGLMCAGWVTRSWGGWLWARWADRWGAWPVLVYTLWGVGLATCGMGFLPSYEQAGAFAPLALTLCRAFQSFCAAGETTLAPLVWIDHQPSTKQVMLTGILQSSTVWGCLMASSISLWVLTHPQASFVWRYPFILGGGLAFVGVLLRMHLKKKGSLRVVNPGLPRQKKVQKSVVVLVACASALGWVTYSLSFVLLNTLVPLVQPTVSVAAMMRWNTPLFVLDAVLMPCIAFLVSQRELYRIRARWALFVAGLVLCGVWALPYISNVYLLGFRLLVMISGVTYTLVFYPWLHQKALKYGYATVGLGSSLGSEVLGRSIPWISLLIFKKFDSLLVVGAYLGMLCLCAYGALVWDQKMQKTFSLNY